MSVFGLRVIWAFFLNTVTSISCFCLTSTAKVKVCGHLILSYKTGTVLSSRLPFIINSFYSFCITLRTSNKHDSNKLVMVAKNPEHKILCILLIFYCIYLPQRPAFLSSLTFVDTFGECGIKICTEN